MDTRLQCLPFDLVYAMSAPNSEALPADEDLIDILKSFDVFMDNSELQHRENVVKQLESLFREWLTEMCEELNKPDVTETVGGKVFTFGSYLLGVDNKGADIDALCLGPGFLERNHFFTSFFEKLRAQNEVKDIRAIEDAFVPIIKMSYEGIEIDLLFARVLSQCVPDDIDLLRKVWLKKADEKCVRSLNGYRVTEEIRRSVSNVHNFKLALRAVKLWAKRRNIYSNALGFLGGVSWAILVARICQQNLPSATASTLVIKFFEVYKRWVWPHPIELKSPEDNHFNLSVWDPTINRSDLNDLMPIITPAYPQQNTAFNVSHSTLAVMMEEIQRGYAITDDVQKKTADWSKLFETPDFLQKYQHFVLLHACSATEKQHLEWVGLVESKIRLLVGNLERSIHVNLAHINLQSFSGPSKLNAKEGKSTKWLIGLAVNAECEDLKKDLTTPLMTFTNMIYRLAKNCKMYKEEMTVLATYVAKDNLWWP